MATHSVLLVHATDRSTASDAFRIAASAGGAIAAQCQRPPVSVATIGSAPPTALVYAPTTTQLSRAVQAIAGFPYCPTPPVGSTKSAADGAPGIGR